MTIWLRNLFFRCLLITALADPIPTRKDRVKYLEKIAGGPPSDTGQVDEPNYTFLDSPPKSLLVVMTWKISVVLLCDCCHIYWGSKFFS